MGVLVGVLIFSFMASFRMCLTTVHPLRAVRTRPAGIRPFPHSCHVPLPGQVMHVPLRSSVLPQPSGHDLRPDSCNRNIKLEFFLISAIYRYPYNNLHSTLTLREAADNKSTKQEPSLLVSHISHIVNRSYLQIWPI